MCTCRSMLREAIYLSNQINFLIDWKRKGAANLYFLISTILLSNFLDKLDNELWSMFIFPVFLSYHLYILK